MDTSRLRDQVRRLNVAELARISGLHRNTIHNWLSGRHDMIAGNMQRLRDAVRATSKKGDKK